MTQQIDNVIILGRAVPETISDGRVTVCVAGYSEALGFIRLYPTRIDSPLKMWSIVSVEVERNPKDSRIESWKFPDSRDGWESINQHMQVVGEWPHQRRMELAESLRCACIASLNDQRLSLGIVRPHALSPYMKTNHMHEKAHQPLFAFIEHANVLTKRDYMLEPRVRFNCGSDCACQTCHDQQLLDWGCYQWMRKYPGQEQQIWQNLHMTDPNWQHYFLVGNQANQRTSFMVINVLRQKAEMFQSPLFSMPRTADGEEAITLAEQEIARAARIATLRAMPYAEYLQTEHWQEVRRYALKRANFRCQVCNRTGILDVHHRTYERRGEEQANDLIVLCRDCHSTFHDQGKLVR